MYHFDLSPTGERGNYKLTKNIMDSEDSVRTYVGPTNGPSRGSGLVGGPIRESEMQRVSQRLHGSLEELHKHIADLEARLEPVLGNDVPRNSSDKASVPEFSSNLAKDISQAVAKVETISELVKSISGRVEV